MNPQPSNTTVNIATGLFLFFFFYFFFNGKKQNMQTIDMMNIGMLYDTAPVSIRQPIDYKITFNDMPKKKKKRSVKQKPKIETESQVSDPIEQSAATVVATKPKTKKEEQIESIKLLAKDCYETLLAIGYKKREAKKLVEDYFKKNPNPDITQFIKDITFKA